MRLNIPVLHICQKIVEVLNSIDYRQIASFFTILVDQKVFKKTKEEFDEEIETFRMNHSKAEGNDTER